MDQELGQKLFSLTQFTTYIGRSKSEFVSITGVYVHGFKTSVDALESFPGTTCVILGGVWLVPELCEGGRVSKPQKALFSIGNQLNIRYISHEVGAASIGDIVEQEIQFEFVRCARALFHRMMELLVEDQKKV
jgi:hypothetical protein